MVTVLVVDDDKVDRMAIKRSFKALKIANPIVEASDGINALDMLRGQNGCEKVRHPCLVLLDLYMPRMGGIEFLEEILPDSELQHMLVFVMTTSLDDEKWARAYAKNVAGYVPKHRPEQSFLTAISMRSHSWGTVRLPI
jgi:CheY-like chemotaxis protein